MQSQGGKRFCFFSANYHPHLGGVENYTQSLAEELVREGHHVTVVTNNTVGGEAHEALPGHVEVYRLPSIPLMGGRMPLPLRNGAYRDAMRELRGRRWDGVLVNTRFYLHSLAGVRLAGRAGLRPIVCDHGSAYLSLNNPVLDAAIRAWEHFITGRLKGYDPAFYGVSEKSVQWLRTFGIQACGVLSNSIDAASFRDSAARRDFRAELGIPAGGFLVCFVGRYVPEKGVQKLLDAMRMLEGRGISLAMAGDGPLREAVDSAASTGLVSNAGRLSRDEVAALLLQSDLLCLPTRSEGFCTTLLEASACGLPSLVTPVGGTDELIPSDRFGSLLPADCDAAQVAASIERLSEDRELVREMGANARRLVEEDYSWQKTAEAFLRANEAANPRRRP